MKNLIAWIDARFPLSDIWNKYFVRYCAPKNLNFWYFFGSLSLFIFAVQLATGVWLTMNYTPTANEAFNSVQAVMRDVRFGWLIRYIHTTGASFFFIVIYLHMYRAIIYGSYQKPRELLWIIGMILYVLLVAEAFLGYVLPWGQMSYWAAEVMSSLVKALPFIGSTLVVWLQGDYTTSSVTLHRYFSFHVAVIPMLMVIFVILHLIALRTVGSNNPEGIDVNAHDTIAFHPYYTTKDLLGLAVFLIVFAAVIFFTPAMGGYFLEPENYIKANPLVTPEHIRPAWYLSPYYAMLRSIPNKALGITVMAAAIAILFVMPWLDRSSVRSLRYKGWYSKIAVTLFVISFISLAYLGTTPITFWSIWLARFFTVLYFLFFFLMPFYTRKEKIRLLPNEVGCAK